jgi:hypothetical protein
MPRAIVLTVVCLFVGQKLGGQALCSIFHAFVSLFRTRGDDCSASSTVEFLFDGLMGNNKSTTAANKSPAPLAPPPMVNTNPSSLLSHHHDDHAHTTATATKGDITAQLYQVYHHCHCH